MTNEPSSDANRTGWERIGAHFLESRPTCDVPAIWDWAMYGTGPGAEVFGDLAGRRVLDLGCGAGRHAAHLVTHHAVHVDAVDYAASQIERANRYFGHLPNVHFHQADAITFLDDAEPYDVVYSVLGLMYLDPHRLLPALAGAVKDDGLLLASVLHTSNTGEGPSAAIAPRTEHAPLKGKAAVPLRMWVLDETAWTQLLSEHGFAVENISTIRPDDGDSPVQCRLIQARRTATRPPARVSSRPRSVAAPTPHATLGVGVIVQDGRGRILLGQHHGGTFELPGGKLDLGEDAATAAARELLEETGLAVRPQDVDVFAMLYDAFGGLNRVTLGAVATAWSGEPVAAEPHLVDQWAGSPSTHCQAPVRGFSPGPHSLAPRTSHRSSPSPSP
ncbi:NUDIX domain-containing protein [Streptomyces sp. N35]|uniref:bifunctional class I SAM-dependent methyltransferase/NUDIX hydrolase n=1 Tax=Streptomyces sp. N35 TaxID=2795730 RepID=UPI0027DE5C0B|nr:NUDIX domain-containing protein [Streptomyces sp. N35]